jgi:ferritin
VSADIQQMLHAGDTEGALSELGVKGQTTKELIDAVTEKVNNVGDALDAGYSIELDVYNQYKEFYEKAQKEDVSVAQYLLQFVEIQRKAVGHYGDLLAKYKIAETTKELLEFDQHIADV